MPPAIVFDLDGTLVDSLGDIRGAMEAVLAELGLPGHPEASYRAFVGDGLRELVRRSLGARAELEEEAVARFRAVYADGLLDRTRPYPGVEAALDRLRARGRPLAVLSNKPHDLTCQVVEALFPPGMFAAVEGHRPERPRKPDPSGALDVAAALGLPASDCILVGDTRVDVETALAAGMTPVGVLWGFRPASELEAAGAARLLARAEELLEL